MKFINRTLLLAVSFTGLFSCSAEDQSEEGKQKDSGEQPEAAESVKDTARIVWSDMDTTVSPKADFFRFVNGKWVDNTTIPEEEKRWSSFNVLKENNEKKLKGLLEEMASLEDQPHYKDLIGKYYLSFMDSARRNELGIQPIEPYLKKVQQAQSINDLLAYLSKHKISIPFGFGIEQDLVKNDQYSPYISQGGLGLPNKTYYFDENKADIREAYKKYITDLFVRIGNEEATATEKMEHVYDIEKRLAQVSMSPIELRQPAAQYNPTATQTFLENNPNIDYKSYFDAIGVKSFDTLIVSQPQFFTKLNELAKNVSLEDWKSYFEFKTINSFAKHLDDETAMLSFGFYQTTLSGVEKRKPGWKRVINELTRKDLGEALGRAFVDQYFSEEAKDKVNTMVDHLEAAFKERLDQLEWMTDSTKQKALEKLASFGRKLGYPEEWEEFESLELNKDDYVGNLIACHEFSMKDNLDKLGKPIDEKEWGMPPHMVNAYYHPLRNEIAFPAGIMQPPFFDATASDAVNYGRIGMVIGHEFTHGFDDMGSKFNAEGAMKNWWTKEDREKFDARAAVLGETFGSFCPFEGICVQPKLTMGENIADLGGLTLAYYAYTKTDEFKSGETVHGYTPSQRFFIAFGQLWKYKIRDEALKEQIATDPHSPGMFRVNGPLMNMPEFFAAFELEASDKMRNEEDKVARIW